MKVAEEIVRAFDDDGDGSVSKDEFVHSLLGFYNNRSRLVSTLSDYESIVSKLNGAMGVASCILLSFVVMFIAEVDVARIGVSWVSVIVAFSFFFGSTAQRFF